MLFLKRILSLIIDTILYYVILTLLYYLPFSISTYILYLISFLLVFTVPIVIFSNSLGLKLLGLKVNSSDVLSVKLSLTLKYFLFFFITTSGPFEVTAILNEIFKSYTILDVSGSTRLELVLCILFANFTYLVYTLGDQSLIDRILKISYSKQLRKVRPNSSLVVAYSITFFLFTFSALEFRFFRDLTFEKFIQYKGLYSYSGYYPIEIFGEYSSGKPPMSRTIITNDYYSCGDLQSILFSKINSQKIVWATVTNDVISSEKKRLLLCEKLVQYSKINEFFEIDSNVVQTLIVLVNHDFLTPFCYIETNYKYYYDNMIPKNGIHGGYRPEKLIEIYDSINQRYNRYLINYLESSLKFNSDSFLNYTNNYGGISIPPYYLPSFKIDQILDSNLNHLEIQQFSEVEPLQMIQFRFLAHDANFLLWDMIQDRELEKLFTIKKSYALANFRFTK